MPWAYRPSFSLLYLIYNVNSSLHVLRPYCIQPSQCLLLKVDLVRPVILLFLMHWHFSLKSIISTVWKLIAMVTMACAQFSVIRSLLFCQTPAVFFAHPILKVAGKLSFWGFLLPVLFLHEVLMTNFHPCESNYLFLLTEHGTFSSPNTVSSSSEKYCQLSTFNTNSFT